MAEPSNAATAVPADDRKAQQCAQKWIAEIGISERYQRRWIERSKKIIRRYKDESDVDHINRKRRYALLWSNTETVKPAVYARPPQAVVGRRFDDADPVARVSSEVLERALRTSVELQDEDSTLKEACADFVLIGRGQTWERYVPTHGPEITPEIGLQIVGDGEEADLGSDAPNRKYADPDGNEYEDGDERVLKREDGTAYLAGEPYRPVVYEESVTDYVNWEDFGHSIARTWKEVNYVWRRVYLSREELVARFGTIGKIVPLDWGPVQQGQRDIEAQMQRKAAIYEIWDKTSKCVYWISKAFSSRPLDERKDPLGLDGFFPCPRPLLATTANDSVIPVADYVFYQDQAEEIDKLTARIAELQDALKVRGFYAGEGKTNLTNLLNQPNNMLIPVPEWIRIKEGGGIKGMIEWWPLDMVIGALNAIIEQRQQLINDVYQLTGISDILRGMNDPASTATAERIKGAWGTLRVRTKQVEMMRFARDGLRIKAEVIAEKFDMETLKAISGVKLPTMAEKQALQAQLQQEAAQAQMMAQMQAAQAPPMGPPMGPGAPPAGPAPPDPMMGHNGGPPMPAGPTEEQQAILESPTWEEVIALLRDNAARNYRIDVETDSTIEPDDAEQKASAIEFTTALGAFIMQWGPQVQANPALAPLAAEVLKFTVRKFRAGRELEAIIDQTMEKIMAAGPPPGEQPEAPDQTPVIVQQMKNQAEAAKQASEDQRAQLQAQLDQMQMQLDAQAEAGKLEIARGDQQIKLVVANRDPEPQSVA